MCRGEIAGTGARLSSGTPDLDRGRINLCTLLADGCLLASAEIGID